MEYYKIQNRGVARLWNVSDKTVESGLEKTGPSYIIKLQQMKIPPAMTEQAGNRTTPSRNVLKQLKFAK